MEKTKFICHKAPSYKVTIVPRRRVINESGASELKPGKMAVFSKGVLETDDKDVIKRLRGHPWYGNHIVEITAKEEAKIKKRIELEKKKNKEINEELNKFDKE